MKDNEEKMGKSDRKRELREGTYHWFRGEWLALSRSWLQDGEGADDGALSIGLLE